MKKFFFAFFILFLFQSKAQLSGVVNVPATYSSIASAMNALNQQGTSGALTVNIVAGYTETCPVGGYSLTASGSVGSPIVFQKIGSGTNPLITAYNGGSGTPGSMNQDGIWRLVGSDYIMIDGIDLIDLNTSNPSTMEFGFGLFKANGSDGCQNNTIKNCVITLNRINNSSGSGPAIDGSRGIDVVNASSNAHNSAIAVISSAGSHSNNKFYANKIQNCNIGISLIGFVDSAPFSFADTGNDVGGNSLLTGNTIIDFGGGGVSNSAAGVRTLAQYDLNVRYNSINNNTGAGIDHPVILRGIYLNTAASANVTVSSNTITLHAGGTSSQLSVIENVAGSGPASNSVIINNNVIQNCTYASATSGPFYGIWNTASAENLDISGNVFLNNSTSAASGSTYLIYNNGAVSSGIKISNNQVGFTYNGPTAYTGNMYSIYNANGTTSTSLSISYNTFSNYYHTTTTGTGNLYFIYNTNDCSLASINGNSLNNISLNHSAAEYFINNNSSTQSVLTVNNNSVLGSYARTGSAGVTYLYYGTGASPSNCVQTYTANNFSNITASVSGTGNFYGLYTSDGSGSYYPKKIISDNIISGVNINSTGSFYGYYMDNSGDAGSTSGSAVFSNTLSNIVRGGVIYGIYVGGSVSPANVPKVYSNVILNLNSSGNSSTLYSAYLAGGGAGLNFYKNKISDAVTTGTNSQSHGIYVNSAVNTTLANNCVGNINAPNSSATNAVNGIYINGGALIHAVFNTVYLNALSTGGNFNSNALYASTTSSLNLRNNIFLNLSSGGSGISAVFRRSSTSLVNYLSTSNNNLFYAGIPGPSNIILQNGAAAYQTLSSIQTLLTPRESASLTQTLSFLNTTGSSPNYLHITPNVPSLTESSGNNISGITDDFDGQVRQGNVGYTGSGTAPDLGADEYNQNLSPCSSANAGIISPLTYTLCAGQTATFISNGYTPGTGLTHQWKIATISGGPYINVSGGAGSLTPEYISNTMTPGTYYFVMVTSCPVISLSATSAEATVVVNAIPNVSVSVTSSLICAGESIYLSGNSSPAANCSWTGPNGFNSSVQNPTITNTNANFSGIYYVSGSANNCISPQASVAVTVSEVTLGLMSSSTVLCLGGTATLNLNSSAVTYTWNTNSNSPTISVSPTLTTSYNVTVTNTANCTLSKSISIGVINPSISANNTLICGNSGTANLSVNAFTPSTISWYVSPTSTIPVGTGTNYILSVSTNTTLYSEASNTIAGCISLRIPVTVSLSPTPVLMVSANPSLICPGKTSTLIANGATTYSWSGTGTGSIHVVSPTGNAVYTVTGKDIFGCPGAQTIVVSMYPASTVTVVQTATSICPSGVVGFTATGVNTYTWNLGTIGPITTVTPAMNSIYSVSGTDSNGCITINTVAVMTRSVPAINIVQLHTTVCPGEPVSFTVTGANSFTWLPGNVTTTTFVANPLVSSVYNAIGKSINSCTSVAFAFVDIDPCTDLIFESFKREVTVFPNPSNGRISFDFSFKGKKLIRVSNVIGDSIGTLETENRTEILDLTTITKGMYFVEISYQGFSAIYKILIQ